MNRQYLSAGDRKRQILDVAAGLVAERGFDAMTMPDLAAAAGISIGGLYRHFPSKRDLVVALVDDDAERVAQTSADVSSLAELLAGELRALGGSAELAVRAEIMATASRDQVVAQSATRHDDRWAAEVGRLVRLQSKPGSLGAIEPDAVVELAGVLVDGIAARSAVVGNVDPGYADLVAVVVGLALRAPLSAAVAADGSGS